MRTYQIAGISLGVAAAAALAWQRSKRPSGGGTSQDRGKSVVTVGRAREEVERRWRERGGRDDVTFRAAPGGRGTVVELPDDGREAADELRRFKQVVETGEAIVSDATVRGNGMPQRPARPPEQGRTPVEAGR